MERMLESPVECREVLYRASFPGTVVRTSNVSGQQIEENNLAPARHPSDSAATTPPPQTKVQRRQQCEANAYNLATPVAKSLRRKSIPKWRIATRLFPAPSSTAQRPAIASFY